MLATNEEEEEEGSLVLLRASYPPLFLKASPKLKQAEILTMAMRKAMGPDSICGKLLKCSSITGIRLAHKDPTSTSRSEMDKVMSAVGSVNPKVAAGIAAGVTAAVAAPIAIPAAAAAIGFTSTGVAMGSTAASMMSVAWTSGQGVWLISGLQSIGAAGLGLKGVAAAGAAAAPAAYKIAGLFTKMPPTPGS